MEVVRSKFVELSFLLSDSFAILSSCVLLVDTVLILVAYGQLTDRIMFNCFFLVFMYKILKLDDYTFLAFTVSTRWKICSYTC